MIASFSTVAFSFADADFVGQTIRKELGVDKPKVALVLDKAAYCDNWTKFGEEIFPKMGYEVVGTWRPNYKQTDLYAEANAIKSSGAHLIYTVMAGPSGAAFVNAWGKLKIPSAVAGTVTASQKSDFWETSGGACNYLASYDSIGRVKMTDQTIPFYDKYMKRFGEKPGWGSPFMQCAVLALKQALERADTFDTDAVIAALEKTDLHASNGRLKFYGIGHQYPHQAIFGHPYRTLISFQWRDGKTVVYFPNASEVNPALAEADKEGITTKLKDVKYEGTGEYQLPPWMVEHYKKKSQ
jgi:branched-chain amino acid transport system substrate-binding protein